MKKLPLILVLLALILGTVVFAQVAGRRIPIADSTIHVTDGTVDEADLSVTNSPTDNYVLTYDDATKTFTWVATGGGDANKSDIHDTIAVHWTAFVDDVPESGDFGGAADLDADGGITAGVIDTADLTDTEFWEYVQDHAGGMFTGNTETGISVTYNEDGTVDFVVSVDTSIINDTEFWEYVQDHAGGMFTGNTETRIAVTYNEDGTVDFVVDDMNDDVPDAGDFGAANDLDANGEVADDSHNHVYSNIDETTSANWIDRVSDETGTGIWVFGTSPTFTTNLTSPLVIGGTTTTSDLSFKTTSGVGASGADMHFLVGNNGATEAVTILNNGNVGIGIATPSSITHIKGNTPGTVGSHPAGQLIIQNPTASVFSNVVITAYDSDVGGAPDQQLWYLGSSSISNSDITFLNRRSSSLHLGTNSATRMTIDNVGNVGIGDISPAALLTVGDGDDFQVSTTGGISTTGTVDWSGATSLEIPNGANPTTDAEGEIAWDANDDAIEVYMGDEGESALIPAYQKIDALIFAPDGVNDQIAIMHVDALLYPFGIEIDQVSITIPADAAYSMVFEEWAGDPPAAQNDISTVTTGGTDSYAEEAPDTDAAIDADDYIFLDIPATDVDWIHVQVIYHVNDGN